ncbi:hypothetical protein BCR39DRAFT_542507 [Naematelia encephala]|uniref:Uncharacterized protein n=1 Tax=Naematelia encephala TaxID=71784 RepID=A0A1Y2AVG5_9TREE|nr:hypothetical protein BCR39DRAFT_542507 [Naematelia encephala]
MCLPALLLCPAVLCPNTLTLFRPSNAFKLYLYKSSVSYERKPHNRARHKNDEVPNPPFLCLTSLVRQETLSCTLFPVQVNVRT